MKLSRETEDRLHRGKRKILDSFGSDPNITGAGIGFRRRDGQWTEEPAVVVLVAKKRPPALVSNRRLLPTTVEVDGVVCEVDVIQAGPFTTGTVPATAAAGKVTGRMRPPRPGCSISNPMDGNTAGTLGLFVLDNKDGKVCLLSNNHVIARMGRATPLEDIIQPGVHDGGTRPDDIIAYVKRWAPTDDGTSVDAAIAELTDQKDFVLEPALDRMPGPSAEHPLVGIHTAGDRYGTNALVRMDKALAALDVSVAVRDASGKIVAAPDAVVAPKPFMKIEKVGRTSGYSSSIITAIGVESYLDSIRFTDLILTESFGSPGDSGSAVFVGGDGSTLVEPEEQRPCPILSTVGDYYRLPLTQDNDLADDLRDDFLAQSLVGRLLIRLPYLNQQSVIDRLAGRQATGSELSYALQYYTKYHDFMASVLANPDSTAVVTQEHLDDAAVVIWGLGQSVLDTPESKLAGDLYKQALLPTLGMNRRQVQAYMNRPDVYKLVYEAIATVPTIETNGPMEMPR